MANPILQALANAQNSLMGKAMAIKCLMQGKTPEAAYNYLAQSNPKFKSEFDNFLRQNQGKTPEQIAKENNIDISVINNLFR